MIKVLLGKSEIVQCDKESVTNFGLVLLVDEQGSTDCCPFCVFQGCNPECWFLQW